MNILFIINRKQKTAEGRRRVMRGAANTGYVCVLILCTHRHYIGTGGGGDGELCLIRHGRTFSCEFNYHGDDASYIKLDINYLKKTISRRSKRDGVRAAVTVRAFAAGYRAKTRTLPYNYCRYTHSSQSGRVMFAVRCLGHILTCTYIYIYIHIIYSSAEEDKCC